MIQKQEIKILAKTISGKDATAQIDSFEESINSWLADGWMLHGSMKVVESGGKSLAFVQPLKREWPRA
jgi:hypothetical protein